MKRIFALAMIGGSLLVSTAVNAQADKSKRPSPPATATQTLDNGATITIAYSQPAVKGRTIGENLEPKKGEVWRMGANEATVFETNRDLKVEGQLLPEGKYGLFGLWEEDGFTLIFNNVWDISGTMYDEIKDKDALRVKIKPRTTETSQERLTYTIDKSGKITLLWGTMALDFKVK